MAPKFGTSGLRGLVVDLTPELVSAHVAAFLAVCPVGSGVFVGRDLRGSSTRIADDVIRAARTAGVNVTDCGALPTPALALAAVQAAAGAVMVTGSHIPADRNGLKFYTPEGEITKAHETAILAQVLAGSRPAPVKDRGALRTRAVGPDFVARYVVAFGAQALAGRRVGVWSHSAVGRDLLLQTLAALGAEVVEIARSAAFIPVDTEAVSDATRRFLCRTAASHSLDAVVSTDGDGDRPMVTDETGTLISGDVLGQITARLLSADVVVTPISSNTGVEKLGLRVRRTKIGSPFVIAGMKQALAENAADRVVGYEANGGFLLGFNARLPGPLARLMTRDSHLPIIAALVSAGVSGLKARVAAEAPRFTASDRLQNVSSEMAAALVARLTDDKDARAAFLLGFGEILQAYTTTDGLRLFMSSGRIVHIRPSGNAPELRIYIEAETVEAAGALLAIGLRVLRESLVAPDHPLP